jgi:hypothetical protein
MPGRCNIRRGLIRAWVLFTTIWLITAGGFWLAAWWSELPIVWRDFVATVAPVNYEALCAKLRAQRAAGGPVDEIPAIPALEVVVAAGVAKVVAAPGRCLAVFAKEEGVDLIPVAIRVVGGDGSAVQQIEGQSGEPVRWKDRTGVFRRDVGDGEHAEIVIAERVYRVRIGELS